jgi:hypothetical protein
MPKMRAVASTPLVALLVVGCSDGSEVSTGASSPPPDNTSQPVTAPAQARCMPDVEGQYLDVLGSRLQDACLDLLCELEHSRIGGARQAMLGAVPDDQAVYLAHLATSPLGPARVHGGGGRR